MSLHEKSRHVQAQADTEHVRGPQVADATVLLEQRLAITLRESDPVVPNVQLGAAVRGRHTYEDAGPRRRVLERIADEVLDSQA